MTPEKARTKWCPMARVLSYPSTTAAANREVENANPSTSRCIADDCMMWVPGEVTNEGRCGLVRE